MTTLVVGKNLPGSRNDEFFSWEDAANGRGADVGGAFEVEQQIQRQIRADPTALSLIYDVPDDKDTYLWQYEHLRQVMKELNVLVARLDGSCTRDSCPVMKATDDWVFLCAAHKAPKECCAFEYIVHTMDNVNTLLTSSRVFPSRVSISSNATQYFQSVSRRLYRIFSHTYFHHPEVFREFEDKSYLCHRFVYFALHYCLIPKSLLIIPDIG
ncbi:mob-like protein phocein isoform x1 [Plasmopara halstedii]|uniref:Mob-like protein phocein isoform x1 n=1 Tax=Plasmopara halstedii TaxID=4781 RepID=A0A0P1A614_PLAHL|nr:mob-like protein phocein isoform x1 [Plasmopara halstedii]CEG35584.1 mob-like protein phocein isoform x1 [Plasmopara halstedii]|eukprot:XP_024571953.1 mob-like protein phocein isoform x1 [Plasmopara halstedii]